MSEEKKEGSCCGGGEGKSEEGCCKSESSQKGCCSSGGGCCGGGCRCSMWIKAILLLVVGGLIGYFFACRKSCSPGMMMGKSMANCPMMSQPMDHAEAMPPK